MDRHMLDGRDDLGMLQVRALQAAHEGDADAAGEERVLTIGLLAPAPARIAEDVDVGRPDGQPLVQAAIGVERLAVELRARLDRDDIADLLDQRGVPGRGHAHRLREDGRRSVARDAVQPFAPPVIGGQVQRGLGRGFVDQLRRLLRDGQLLCLGRKGGGGGLTGGGEEEERNHWASFGPRV